MAFKIGLGGDSITLELRCTQGPMIFKRAAILQMLESLKEGVDL